MIAPPTIATGKTKKSRLPRTAPTTAPVSVPLEASFLTWILPSASLFTTAVSSRPIWPSFSRARMEASALVAVSSESKLIATRSDIVTLPCPSWFLPTYRTARGRAEGARGVPRPLSRTPAVVRRSRG